jgi:hypothetical protein
VSLDPARTWVTHPVFVWLELAARLAAAGDRALADEIRQAMHGHRLVVKARVALTADEVHRVDAVFQAWLGGRAPTAAVPATKKVRAVRDEERAAAWARAVALIPEELTAAGWKLWGIYRGATLFDDPSHLVVLRKGLADPRGARAIGEGATEEAAVRLAIWDARTSETSDQ